ncbi:hypothetical protein ACHAWF_003403 [Thalassiosira exigua]
MDAENLAAAPPETAGALRDGETRRLRPGDHVSMRCEAIGGIPYRHHGIVVKVVDEERLYIADFTAPNQSTLALPTSVTSNSSHRGSGRAVPDWHGVRVSAYDASEWRREKCDDDREEAPDDDEVVLRRVTFLLKNPHLLPEYELLESNCETVAVWCKTGRFRTHQVSGLVGGGIRNGAAATGLAVAAAVFLGPIPAVVGAGWTAALALKRSDSEHRWRERTEVLNEEFEKWSRAQDSGCAVQ